MKWTTDKDGYATLDGDDGRFQMRIVPSKTPATLYVLETIKPDGSTDFRGRADSEANARAELESRLLHVIELKALRRDPLNTGRPPVKTPWGPAQSGVLYAEGVASFETSDHGGFKLLPAQNKKVPKPFRNRAGWYEEDGDANIVVHAFPELFTTRDRRLADEYLRDRRPHEYMAATGVTLTTETSHKLAEEKFFKDHENDWVVVSAISSEEDRGSVIATATIGGIRGGVRDGEAFTSEQREFLVPKVEYERRGRTGFVIDLARHPEINPAPAPVM
jgi:hypothetical protein